MSKAVGRRLFISSLLVLFTVSQPPFRQKTSFYKYTPMSPSNVNHLSQPCIYGHIVSSSSTERKSRFMRWLSKLFKGGANNNNNSIRGVSTGEQPQPQPQPQFIGDENMVWCAPTRSLLPVKKTQGG